MAKKYYWMKLQEDFFDDDAIEWMEEQENGKEYALFYLKLCLKSLKTNGLLIRQVGAILVPYDTKKLAEITRTDYDTAAVAMELLKKIGLIEILEGGGISIPRMEEMIGSETEKAAIMRKKREKDRLLPCNDVTAELPEGNGNNVTTELPGSSQNVTQRIENRDRDRARDNKFIVEPSAQPLRDRRKADDFAYRCVDILTDSCKETFPNSKVPKTEAERERWAIEIERMRRLDGRSEPDIMEALKYATTDAFWRGNIRSAKKFREKFETLIIQGRSRAAPKAHAARDRFRNFPQREYDYAELERQLLQKGGAQGGAGDA